MTLALHGKSAKRQAVLIVGALLAIVIGALAVLASGGTGARAASVTPIVVEGNPKCVDPSGLNTPSLGYDYGFKPTPESAPEGAHVVDGFGTITVTRVGSSISWTSTFGIDAVIIKGGPNSNVYYYSPASLGDTDLTPPGTAGFSHVEFCWDDRPETPTTETTTPVTETTTPVTETPTPEPEGEIEIQKYTWNGETWELYVGALFTFDIDVSEHQDVGPGTYTVEPGDYTVSEIIPVLDWEFVAIIQGSDVQGSLVCPESPNGASGGPASLDVTVADGETVLVCAYNEPSPVAATGQICIEKYSDFDGNGSINGADALINWNGTISGPGLTGNVAWSSLASTDEECQYRISGLEVGATYTITEDTVSDWTATNATVGGAGQVSPFTTVTAVASAADVVPVLVTFHNQPDVDETPTPVTETPTPVTATPTTPIIPTSTPTNTPVVPTNTPVVPTNTPVVPTNTPVVPTNTPVVPTVQPTEIPTAIPTVDEVAGEITPGAGVGGTPIPPASGSGNAVAAGTTSMTMVLLAMLFITSGGLALVAARKRN